MGPHRKRKRRAIRGYRTFLLFVYRTSLVVPSSKAYLVASSEDSAYLPTSSGLLVLPTMKISDLSSSRVLSWRPCWSGSFVIIPAYSCLASLVWFFLPHSSFYRLFPTSGASTSNTATKKETSWVQYPSTHRRVKEVYATRSGTSLTGKGNL